MPKQDVDLAELWPQTLHALEHEGALLVVAGKDGKANPMTIGWGTIGNIWGRRVFVVLVRPSRFTYGLMEEAGDFTVNVLPAERAGDANLCGTRSGRDCDKLRECGLTAAPSRRVRSPILEEAIIHYECRVVFRNDVTPDVLAPEIRSRCYPGGDFHRIYFGEVLSVYAEPDARQRASGP
ncbi:MAG: flavin reductase family protein [Armatimonadetes bacterium]|nr:flavin reductase family protein [Armatimonadota bacterium]